MTRNDVAKEVEKNDESFISLLPWQ